MFLIIEKCRKSSTKTADFVLRTSLLRRSARRRPAVFPPPSLPPCQAPSPAGAPIRSDRTRPGRCRSRQLSQYAAGRYRGLAALFRLVPTTESVPSPGTGNRRTLHYRSRLRVRPSVTSKSMASQPSSGASRRSSGIVPSAARRTAPAEGSDLPKKSDRHAGDAHPRFVAWASRPGHDAAARLCRRSASLGDHRARPDRRWARLGRNFRQRRAGVPAWHDRLARGRDRPWLVRRHLPYRSAGAHR